MIEVLFSVLLAAAGAQAQITTSRGKVLVTGMHCNELKDVYLVVNGNDLAERWVRLDPAGTCRWTADLGAGSISTGKARFSLRADRARSDCQRASPNEEEMSADLEFACCVQGPLHSMSVKTVPSMSVTYYRNVRAFAGSRVPGIKDCVEKATFDAGEGSIGQAQFNGEDVYLNYGQYNWKQQPPGLLLNKIVVDGRPLDLTRDDVVFRMTVQRAQGKAGSVPTLSSNAIALENKRLTDLKLERTRIEVIK
jgi:hypothetical protein